MGLNIADVTNVMFQLLQAHNWSPAAHGKRFAINFVCVCAHKL